MKLGMPYGAVRGGVVAAVLLNALFAHGAMASPQHGLLLSPSMKAALSAGLSIPLHIRNADAPQVEGSEQAAVATVNLIGDGDEIYIQNIQLEPELDYALSGELQKKLAQIEHVPASSGEVELADGANLKLDLTTMQAILQVDRQAFAVTGDKDNYLAASQTGLSGMVNYTANAYKSKDSDLESYLSFNSLTGYKEHHLFLDGSFLANAGGDGGLVELDRALYEHDFNGRNLSVGRVSGWGLQSFADVSTLDGQTFYGASYGNYSQAVVSNAAVSLIPITLYLPSAGEARVFRNGRLIDIQRFSMGSHSLDTSRLPGGIYNVTVRIAVGSEVISSREYRVNKPNNRDNTGADGGLAWQVWGGYTAYNDDFGDDDFASEDFATNQVDLQSPEDPFADINELDGADDGRHDDTAILGLSLAGNWQDLQWGGSLYQKGETSVLESNLSYPLLDELSLDVVSLIGSDGSRQLMPSLNYQAPFGSLWVSSEKTSTGDVLDLEQRASYSVGGSIELDNLIRGAGTLNFSFEKDFDSGSFNDEETGRYTRVDYVQEVYNSHYGAVQLSAGIDFNRVDGNESHDKYVALTLTMPLGDSVSAGYSSGQEGRSLNLEYEKSLEGTFNTIGATTGFGLGGDQDTLSSYTAYTDYDAKYSTGSVSLQGDSESFSTSINSSGSAAWSKSGLAASGVSGDSGIVIQLPEHVVSADAELAALINGTSYPLNKSKTLIPLAPYKTYKVQIVNGAAATGSYQVQESRREFTLYPGNIASMDVGVKQMVTVFGRLLEEDGAPMAQTKVHNHIGNTVTDRDGYFSIDVSTVYPEVVVSLSQDNKVTMAVPISSQSEAAMWVGNLVCSSSCEWRKRS